MGGRQAGRYTDLYIWRRWDAGGVCGGGGGAGGRQTDTDKEIPRSSV